jgi:hypothetical protein
MRQLLSDFTEFNQHLDMCRITVMFALFFLFVFQQLVLNGTKRLCTVSPLLHSTSNTRIYLLYGNILDFPPGDYLFLREEGGT